ncbi:hypothetical protein [Bosea sp. 124]|uniref:hypothetical protein n=1 Tax=Bosea sp. 124 TaxID=2135642 RepID=UPI0020C0C3EB|nr:hypothetical protein [Bosea sp. 124]
MSPGDITRHLLLFSSNTLTGFLRRKRLCQNPQATAPKLVGQQPDDHPSKAYPADRLSKHDLSPIRNSQSSPYESHPRAPSDFESFLQKTPRLPLGFHGEQIGTLIADAPHRTVVSKSLFGDNLSAYRYFGSWN